MEQSMIEILMERLSLDEYHEPLECASSERWIGLQLSEDEHKQLLSELEATQNFCDHCKEEHCCISLDNTCAMIRKYLNSTQWISVNNMPKESGYYNVCENRKFDKKQIVHESFFDAEAKKWTFGNKRISHWQPLPATPKDEHKTESERLGITCPEAEKRIKERIEQNNKGLE